MLAASSLLRLKEAEPLDGIPSLRLGTRQSLKGLSSKASALFDVLCINHQRQQGRY